MGKAVNGKLCTSYGQTSQRRSIFRLIRDKRRIIQFSGSLFIC